MLLGACLWAYIVANVCAIVTALDQHGLELKAVSVTVWRVTQPRRDACTPAHAVLPYPRLCGPRSKLTP